MAPPGLGGVSKKRPLMLVNAYCTKRELPALAFPHRLVGRRDRSDPEMLADLGGFMDYLFPEGSEMNARLYGLMRHVQRARHQLSLEIEESAFGELGVWLSKAHGVAFLPDGSVRDHSGRNLFHPHEPADESASLPVSALALERKGRSESKLVGEQIDIATHLPVVISEEEVELRPAREVAERALALVLVALRGESLGAGEPIPTADMRERQPLGFAALTPAEREFMEDPAPAASLTVAMSWRYEALLVLLWSLSMMELPPPTEICDVPSVVDRMLESDEKPLIEGARLRDPGEILDALDLHYRAHWAVRQAQLGQSDAPAGLIPGVVLERHYALNWLTRLEDAPWDEVDTPT